MSTNKDKLETSVRNDRALAARELTKQVGISIGSCGLIQTENLNIKRVSPNFMLRLLAEERGTTGKSLSDSV